MKMHPISVTHAGAHHPKSCVWLEWLDSPTFPLLITALMYFVLMFIVVQDQGYNFSYFVRAGEEYCQVGVVPRSLAVQPSTISYSGYDGQFNYRLALDPFTAKVTDFGIRLDNPAYRQQRILYPLVVWGLSFGCVACVPAMMLAVNLFCLCALAWVGAVFARSVRLHSLWGLAFPFYPGFLLTLELDLSEILCATLLLGALLCVRSQKYLPATGLLILAILTRETVLLVAGAAAYVYLKAWWKNKVTREAPAYFAAFAFLAYAVWQLILLRNWGYRLWNEGHGRAAHRAFGLPFVAFFSRLAFFAGSKLHRLEFVEMLLILAFAAAVAWSLRSSVASPLERSCWLVYAALVCLLAPRMWLTEWGFLRILPEFYVFGTIILLLSSSRMKSLLLTCWGTVWLTHFLQLTDIVHRVPHWLARLALFVQTHGLTF